MPMSPRSRRCLRIPVLALTSLALTVAAPRIAAAQWYFDGYLGANYTHPARVAVDLPAADLAVEFDSVRFSAEPFKAPQYYGWRLGRMFATGRRLGVELEFIHLKVISETSQEYAARGHVGTTNVAGLVRMDSIVQRYSMTHGLNFVLINLVARRPLSDRIALTARLGGGGTLPHAEATVLGVSHQRYEYAGLGAHGSAGIDVSLRGRLSLLAEYKLSAARPKITVADPSRGGSAGHMRALTHHVAFGFGIALTK
jgi:hypothetical protein